MARVMPLPLTVSCFNKIQIGFTFLVQADPGSPGKRAVKRVCGGKGVCVKRLTDRKDEVDENEKRAGQLFDAHLEPQLARSRIIHAQLALCQLHTHSQHYT